MSVTAMQAHAFACRIESLAEDIGRLRRRLRNAEKVDEYGSHLVDSLALHAEMLDAFSPHFRGTGYLERDKYGRGQS